MSGSGNYPELTRVPDWISATKCTVKELYLTTQHSQWQLLILDCRKTLLPEFDPIINQNTICMHTLQSHSYYTFLNYVSCQQNVCLNRHWRVQEFDIDFVTQILTHRCLHSIKNEMIRLKMMLHQRWILSLVHQFLVTIIACGWHSNATLQQVASHKTQHSCSK